MPKKKVRTRHVPQRTCVGCREIDPKRSLIRIVRGPAGVVIDPSGKLSGRGAYLHNNKSCWEKGLKGTLETALKTKFDAHDQEQLMNYMQTLRENEPSQETIDASTAS